MKLRYFTQWIYTYLYNLLFKTVIWICGKISIFFFQKLHVHFLCLLRLYIGGGVNPKNVSIKNEIYSSTSHKRKMIKRGTNRLLNFITIASKTSEKLSSVAASFYIFWHLYSDPNRNFKSKYQNKTFHLVILASHKAYSHSLH